MTWPDYVIAIVVLFGALKGLRRGLVNELTGLLALGFGLIAAFTYRGFWDDWFARSAHLAPVAAHVTGMLAYAAVAYAVVLALGAALSAVARLPIVGIANSALGALVGAVKSAAFVWAILYVALFFPLPAQVRHDLRGSPLAQALQRPNTAIDAKLRAALPDIGRPFSDNLFAQHRL